jgi:hypothetical protein
VAHHRFGCINNAIPKINQGKESSVLLAPADGCSAAQSHIEAGPDVEGAAPERHIATVTDAAKVRHLKPERSFPINDPFVGA